MDKLLDLSRKYRLGWCIIVCVFLASCTQAPVVSALQLKIGSSDQHEIELIEAILTAKASSLGGSCKRFSETRQLLQCSGFDYGELSELTSGFRNGGEFYVKILSWGTPLFPPSKEKLNTGDYLPKKHAELEEWLFSSFSNFHELRKYRSYQGRKIVLEFALED